MTRSELSAAVATRLGLSVSGGVNVVAAVLQSIAEGVAESGRAQLAGFGTFAVKRRPARKGFKPGTRDTYEVPARDAVVFRPANEWAAKVAAGKTTGATP